LYEVNITDDVVIKNTSIATHFTISPNPTYSDAVISFGLLENSEITLEICDLLGNIFYSVTDFYDVGEHFVPLEIKGISNGSYICRLLLNGRQIGMEKIVVGK
jgi:hypothetical protein